MTAILNPPPPLPGGKELKMARHLPEPEDITYGSLSKREADQMLEILTRHFNERVAPVSEYCQGFYDWQQAIKAKLERLKANPDEYTVMDADYWQSISEALTTIGQAVAKSSMLWRRIYGGEPLRTRMCPAHKGRWVGIGNPACGCQDTGWLPAQEKISEDP